MVTVCLCARAFRSHDGSLEDGSSALCVATRIVLQHLRDRLHSLQSTFYDFRWESKATFTKSLSSKLCFADNRLLCLEVILSIVQPPFRTKVVGPLRQNPNRIWIWAWADDLCPDGAAMPKRAKFKAFVETQKR